LFEGAAKGARVQSDIVCQLGESRSCAHLARLLSAQRRGQDARALLQPVFEQFTEGLDTADLKAAERLLATLA
jgi:predicted ATPase